MVLILLIFIHCKNPYFSSFMAANGGQVKWDLANEPRGYKQLFENLKKKGVLKEVEGIVSYHYTICSQLYLTKPKNLNLLCINNRKDAYDYFHQSTKKHGNWLFISDWRYKRKASEIYHNQVNSEEQTFEYKSRNHALKRFHYQILKGPPKMKLDAPGI